MNIADVIRVAYDWVGMWREHGRIDYYKYIRSPKWKRLSREAKERSGWKCALCNSGERLETHHKTYANLGHERPEDLIVLCHRHHEMISR
jgi:hypothetical protein